MLSALSQKRKKNSGKRKQIPEKEKWCKKFAAISARPD
jgi:hypothetical protein